MDQEIVEKQTRKAIIGEDTYENCTCLVINDHGRKKKAMMNVKSIAYPKVPCPDG